MAADEESEASHRQRGCLVGIGVAVILVIVLGVALVRTASYFLMPNGRKFMPLPDGVELVDERVWCAGDAPQEWVAEFGEEGCTSELRVRRHGQTAEALAKELGEHYRPIYYWSRGLQRFVRVSPGAPDMVSLVEHTS